MFCVCVMVEVEITSTCPTMSAERKSKKQGSTYYHNIGRWASAVSSDVVGESKNGDRWGKFHLF